MSPRTLQFPSTLSDRYEDLADQALAAMLREEDAAEDRGVMSALDRITCRVHRRWIHECIASPTHVIAVTGHRWCRRCESPACVSIDYVGGMVSVVCMRCGRIPGQAATEQIIRTCRASLAASRHAAHTMSNAA